MCQDKTICRSRDEIRDWLSGKYIVLLYNQIVFQSDEFGDSSVAKESRLTYIPISS